MNAILSLLAPVFATYFVSAAVNFVRRNAFSDKVMLVIVALISAGATAVDTLWLGSTENVISVFLAGIASTFFHQLIKSFSKQ